MLLSHRSIKLVTLLTVAAAVSGCMTDEDRRMQADIKQKRAHLADLHSQLADLDDQVTQQLASLRVQQSAADEAATQNRITQSERDAAQSEMHQEQQTLDGLRQKIADRKREADRLKQEAGDNKATLERQHQLVAEIAELRDEIRSCEDSMRERAEQRAKHYNHAP